MAKRIMNNKWICFHRYCRRVNIEHKLQNFLTSYITKLTENSISERLIFKIFWGSMPPDPLQENTDNATGGGGGLPYGRDGDARRKFWI